MMKAATETSTETPCPKPLPVVVENIPAELRQLDQWVTWKFEYRDRWTKPPYRVDGSGYAKANDATTWGSFGQALATYERGLVQGVGFEPTAELGLVLIDLDHCIDSDAKKISPWASEIVARFATYVERSPVDGVRIIARGTLPQAGRKKGDVEIYSATHYLTLTGQKFKGKPATIEPCQEAIDWLYETYFKEPEREQPKARTNGNGAVHWLDDELLEKAFSAKNGDKLKRLFNGDTLDHNGDDSAADFALCSRLAFWTNGDPGQMDRIFRRSGLMREKWDQKHGEETYGSRTINRALASTTERYERRQKFQDRAKQPSLPEFLSAEQILNEPDDPIDYRLDSCLPAAGASVLVAQPKVGKSTFAAQLAISIARGISFLGRETQQCAVAYAYLDGPKAEIKQAFKKLGLKPSDPVFIYAGGTPSDKAADNIAWIVAQIEQRGAKFIVIDTFQKFFKIDNLNDYSEVIKKSTPLLDVAADKNVHLLFLHHAGKGDKGDLDSAIGSTAIRGQVQSYLHIKKLPDSERRIFRTDQRHGEGNFPEVAIGFDRQGWLEIKGTREDAEVQEAKPKIRELLETEDGALTERKIRAAIPIRGIIVSKALREMHRDDAVKRSGNGTRGNAFRYLSTGLCKKSLYSSPIYGNGYSGTRIENSEKSLANKGEIQVPENRDTNGTQIFKSQTPGHESEATDKGGEMVDWEPI